MKNIHVPLQDELHERLTREAKRLRRPVTQLARDAIDSWVRAQERQVVHDAIDGYACRHAGTPLDLDEDLERMGLEHLDSGEN